MDLYEALKNGASPEELTTAFNNELAAATKKIAEEETAKKLSNARRHLAEAYWDYLNCYMNGCPLTIEQLYELLSQAEDFNTEVIPKETENKSKTDIDILKSFIKTLV